MILKKLSHIGRLNVILLHHKNLMMVAMEMIQTVSYQTNNSFFIKLTMGMM